MTDIVRYSPAVGWVDTLPAIGDLAVKIADTAFVPESFRHKPAEVAAAILTGQEVGLGPMASLSGISVIKGKPTLSAATMRALILAHGHEIWTDEMTDHRVVLCGRRAGSDNVSRVAWTMDDAKRAGLTGNDTYRKYPRQMLLARATGELARLLFADILGGIAYAPEELLEGPPDGPAAPTGTTTPKRTARRATAPPVPADEPPLDVPAPTPPPAAGDAPARPRGGGEATDGPGTADEPPLDEHPPGGISPGQSRLLHSLFNQLNVGDRDKRMSMTRGIVGREIGTSNELTKDEAKRVIDELNRLIDQRETQQAVAVVEDIVDGEIVEQTEELPI